MGGFGGAGELGGGNGFASGGFGAENEASSGDVELTERQKQGMMVIEKNDDEIDELAGALRWNLGLKEMAEAMGEELDMQGEMLADVSNSDKAEDEISKANKDLKQILNDPATCCQNQCLNMVLCVIVLGIASVIFNIITKTSRGE